MYLDDDEEDETEEVDDDETAIERVNERRPIDSPLGWTVHRAGGTANVRHSRRNETTTFQFFFCPSREEGEIYGDGKSVLTETATERGIISIRTYLNA